MKTINGDRKGKTMGTNRRKFLNFALGASILGMTATFGLAAKKPAEVVVVKAGGPLENLTLKDIQAIYLGEKLFQGSAKIEPLMNDEDELGDVFFAKILGKSKVQFKKVWKSKAFVDALEPPTQLPSSGDVLATVKKRDAAIGFVAESDLGAAEKKSLKVIYTAAPGK